MNTSDSSPLSTPPLKAYPSGARPVISVRNVSLSFPRKVPRFGKKIEKFWALRDVSFDLLHGESLGVIGRNGSGKSTLLKVLAGIIQADSGQVITEDIHASLLTLQAGFASHLTGRENVILSGILLGLTRSEVEAKMDEIVAFAELGDFIDQPIKTYSSGMVARLGFATAYQVDPDVLLVDEVLGVGDVAFREKAEAIMHEKLCSDKTVVFVSHSAQQVLDLCSRAIWIHAGQIRAEGDPEQVTAKYERFLKRKNFNAD